MTQVEVWNADETLLHRVTVRHAIAMIWRGVATPVSVHDTELFGPYRVPLVVRLVRYVEQKWLYSRTRATYSREGVLLRDRGRCAYCGRYAATTMDHVQPRSRGGATSWANAVAACEPCNARKGDRTPEEAGLPLRWEPYVPTRVQLHLAREALDTADTRTTRSGITTTVTTTGKEPDR
ncbi:HNH endonuclease [Intrasporangium sp. YIM S08009]|uniref:HNH endonuclease n=1 Tax=Intrasporangium zincisolvens TaxID=3080018 RepID=UPI002B0555AA|nr:HNH endonuclease [Intrasporangium sp. YIM S08009]